MVILLDALRVFRPSESGGIPEEDLHGGRLFMTGGDGKERSMNMVLNSDAVLVLPGGKGTLREARLALAAGKQVVIVRDYGAVAVYLQRHPTLKKHPNLHIVDSMPEAVAFLKGLRFGNA